MPDNKSTHQRVNRRASYTWVRGIVSPLAQQAVRGYDSMIKLTASRLPQMAAALSYRTIFGLIPVIVVGLVMVTSFTKPEDIRKIVTSGLEYAGLTTIAVEPTEDEKTLQIATGSMGLGFYAPVDAPPTVGPDGWTNTRLDELIAKLVTQVSSIPYREISIIGILTMIYAAISMFIEVEHAFNQVYRVPDGRSFMRRVVIYWTMLTLGSLGLVATFFVGETVKGKVREISGADGLLVGYLVTIPISTAILLVAYTAIPNTRVKFLPALAGAFIAAVMFEAGKLGFSEYVKYSAGYAKLYGSLALIPLFLLWVYVTWLIVLSGLQLTYKIQHGLLHEPSTAPVFAGPVVIDPGAGAGVLAAAAAKFRDGQGLSAGDAAKETGLSEIGATLLAERLVVKGFLHHVKAPGGHDVGEAPLVGGEEPPMYALARPPETISMEDVLRVTFELADESAEHKTVNPVQREVRAAQLAAAGTRTLSSVLGAVENRQAPSTGAGGQGASPAAKDGPNPKGSGLEPRVAPAS